MKAILVIDKMPKRCGDCQLLQQMYDDEHEKWFDMCFWRYCEIKYTEGKLNDCPLKPLPELKDEHIKLDNWGLESIINAEHRGYNRCLDEILGGEE